MADERIERALSEHGDGALTMLESLRNDPSVISREDRARIRLRLAEIYTRIGGLGDRRGIRAGLEAEELPGISVETRGPLIALICKNLLARKGPNDPLWIMQNAGPLLNDERYRPYYGELGLSVGLASVEDFHDYGAIAAFSCALAYGSLNDEQTRIAREGRAASCLLVGTEEVLEGAVADWTWLIERYGPEPRYLIGRAEARIHLFVAKTFEQGLGELTAVIEAASDPDVKGTALCARATAYRMRDDTDDLATGLADVDAVLEMNVSKATQLRAKLERGRILADMSQPHAAIEQLTSVISDPAVDLQTRSDAIVFRASALIRTAEREALIRADEESRGVAMYDKVRVNTRARATLNIALLFTGPRPQQAAAYYEAVLKMGYISDEIRDMAENGIRMTAAHDSLM